MKPQFVVPFFVLLVVLGAGCAQKDRPGVVSGPNNRTTGATLRPEITFTLCSDGLPTTGMWKCDPILADFNGDGFLDLAALPRLGRGPRVWLGNGKGSWKESSTGLEMKESSCGGGLAAADVNGDGLLDLVIGDHCQGVYVYLGDGAGSWRMVTHAMNPTDLGTGESYTGAEDLDVGDFNGDGFLDIVTGAQDNGGIQVYFGDGTGANWTRQKGSPLPATGWANRVRVCDLNNDGLPDLFASYGEGPRAWHGDGKGGWTPVFRGLPTPMVQGLFNGIDVGDVNHDGRMDVVLANWIDGPEVFIQEADGDWRDHGDVFPDMHGGAYGVKFEDLDGDGHLDIIASGRLTEDVGHVYGLFVLKGDGKGNWRHLKNTGLPETGLSTAWGITTGDVNGDGIPDIVFATGGIVGSEPDRHEPVMPIRLQVWCTQLTGSQRAVLANAHSVP